MLFLRRAISYIESNMKSYPSIQFDIIKDSNTYIFDKLDGSNIRVEWTKKNGFCKFGTRTRLLDPKEEPLGETVSLFNETFESELQKILKANCEKAVCFFEFFGENSFAGNHEYEKHKLVLIDVSYHKKGILNPKNFLDTFGHLCTPKLLHVGKVGNEFIESVKHSTLEGMTFEGIVGKVPQHKKPPKMFKIKSRAWLTKLKNYCNDNEALFTKLS